jgi:hypothetical protein
MKALDRRIRTIEEARGKGRKPVILWAGGECVEALAEAHIAAGRDVVIVGWSVDAIDNAIFERT